MKIEIEKSEYDRLKSREEKLMAYYEWFVDKENDLATVEDVVNKNIELEEENKKLKDEVKDLVERNIELDKKYMFVLTENNKLKVESEFLEQCLDNKEKVNKSLREELEWYRGFDNYLTNHGFDMKKLKENIKNQN